MFDINLLRCLELATGPLGVLLYSHMLWLLLQRESANATNLRLAVRIRVAAIRSSLHASIASPLPLSRLVSDGYSLLPCTGSAASDDVDDR